VRKLGLCLIQWLLEFPPQTGFWSLNFSCSLRLLWWLIWNLWTSVCSTALQCAGASIAWLTNTLHHRIMSRNSPHISCIQCHLKMGIPTVGLVFYNSKYRDHSLKQQFCSTVNLWKWVLIGLSWIFDGFGWTEWCTQRNSQQFLQYQFQLFITKWFKSLFSKVQSCKLWCWALDSYSRINDYGLGRDCVLWPGLTASK